MRCEDHERIAVEAHLGTVHHAAAFKGQLQGRCRLDAANRSLLGWGIGGGEDMITNAWGPEHCWGWDQLRGMVAAARWEGASTAHQALGSPHQFQFTLSCGSPKRLGAKNSIKTRMFEMRGVRVFQIL